MRAGAARKQYNSPGRLRGYERRQNATSRLVDGRRPTVRVHVHVHKGADGGERSDLVVSGNWEEPDLVLSAGGAEPGYTQTHVYVRWEGEWPQVPHRGRGDEARPVGADAMGKQVHVDGVIHEIVIYCVVHMAEPIAVVPPRLPTLKVLESVKRWQWSVGSAQRSARMEAPKAWSEA